MGMVRSRKWYMYDPNLDPTDPRALDPDPEESVSYTGNPRLAILAALTRARQSAAHEFAETMRQLQTVRARLDQDARVVLQEYLYRGADLQYREGVEPAPPPAPPSTITGPASTSTTTEPAPAGPAVEVCVDGPPGVIPVTDHGEDVLMD